MTPAAPAVAPMLKPCPFCSESEGVYLDDPGPTHPHSAIVRCSGCNAVQCHNTAAEAIAAWNTRTRAEPTEAQIERAKLAIWHSLHDSFTDRERKAIKFHEMTFDHAARAALTAAGSQP